MIIYIILLGLALFIFYKRIRLARLRSQSNQGSQIVGLLHPNCNAGGGGEKVLMCMLQKLQQEKKYKIIVYCSEVPSIRDEDIINKANTRFNTTLTCSNLHFERVLHQRLLEPKRRLTMLFQILGQMLYAYYCINRCQPHLFVDSTGLPFTYLIVKLFLPKIRIVSYVHYPFISYDMISQVRSQQNRFNNQEGIAKSKILTQCKLVYYNLILFFYRICGYFVDYAFTNSTWTHNHMKELWRSTELVKLYPPCSVEVFMKRKTFSGKFIIVSFAQFRPEKRQDLQIEIMNSLVSRLPQEISQGLKLYMIGSVRNNDDMELYKRLELQVERLGLKDYIEMRRDPTFKEVVELLGQGMIGLHTMEYEHFGITLVEMLAAGLIVVAHNSAGPKEDILTEDSGLLCDDLEDYVMGIVKIMQFTDEERREYQVRGRRQAVRFSEEAFIREFKLF